MMKAISILLIGALAAIVAGCLSTQHNASATGERYPWKKNIVTTVFWIGERPSRNNPVPNRRSSWDKDWTRNYGGFDDSKSCAPEQLHSGKVHASTEPILLCPPIQRQVSQWSPAGSAPRRSVVQGSVPRPRRFHLQGSMGRDSQRQSNGLCAMGRRRTIPNGLLAIRVWKRTTKTHSEQRCRSRCFTCCARLPRFE